MSSNESVRNQGPQLPEEEIQKLTDRALNERIGLRSFWLGSRNLRRSLHEAFGALGAGKTISLAALAEEIDMEQSSLRDLVSKVTGRTPSNGGLQILKAIVERLGSEETPDSKPEQ